MSLESKDCNPTLETMSDPALVPNPSAEIDFAGPYSRHGYLFSIVCGRLQGYR